MNIELSVVPYNDGTYDIILRDADSGDEIVLSGEREFTENELTLLDRIAPTCVYTRYVSREGSGE